MYEPASAKLWIGSVDNSNLAVEAQYNPKELQIDSPIQWAPHESIAAQTVANKPMEFTGMGVESMKLELLFDAVERNDPEAVMSKIAAIKEMASVRSAYEPYDGDYQRPHFCVVSWGARQPRFECVIESVSVKYQYFTSDGLPLRATVTVSLKSGRRPAGREELAYSRDYQQERIDKDYNAQDARTRGIAETEKKRRAAANRR